MSAMGHKPTSITRLQMVRSTSKSGRRCSGNGGRDAPWPIDFVAADAFYSVAINLEQRGHAMRKITGTLLALALVVSTSASDAQEVHIAHCLKGCPTGTLATNDLVVREILALSSNDHTKFADWVAYRVTRETIGSSDSLNRTWKPDPLLDANETLEKQDYTGANAAHDYDRGHQAPLASFSGTVFWRTTNLLSNITPQKADLNQGAWKELESRVRHAAYHRGGLHVVTGPLYSATASMPALPQADEPHIVPAGYWKAVASDSGQVTAFIFSQNTPRNANPCDHRVTLAEVESQSGLDLFPLASNWPTGNLDAALGC